MKTVLWIIALLVVSAAFIIPSSHDAIMWLTKTHPYVAGFCKFAVLATLGELLSIRIVAGDWKKPPGLISRIVIWGLIGMAITLVFPIYAAGVGTVIKGGMLPVGEVGSGIAAFFTALWISAIMNLSFAPSFMAAHRITDTMLELKAKGAPSSAMATLKAIDWTGFYGFVVFKTLPFFWIPAHTITFLLPPEYRVLMAAYLGIALGCILGYARRKGSK